MNEKEKIKAKYLTRLLQCSRTLTEVREHAARMGVSLADILDEPLPSILRKIENAQKEIEELDRDHGEAWKNLQKRIDSYMHDIDDNLRKALSYYK